MIPYLVLADLQDSALAFSNRVIYLDCESIPRICGFSALQDQQIAGVIMWVPSSLTFLLSVVWLVALEPDAMGAATPHLQ
jgi:hypothetical protein